MPAVLTRKNTHRALTSGYGKENVVSGRGVGYACDDIARPNALRRAAVQLIDSSAVQGKWAFSGIVGTAAVVETVRENANRLAGPVAENALLWPTAVDLERMSFLHDKLGQSMRHIQIPATPPDHVIDIEIGIGIVGSLVGNLPSRRYAGRVVGIQSADLGMSLSPDDWNALGLTIGDP